jgi:hypothetical protein
MRYISKLRFIFKLWGLHGGDYKQYRVLCCVALWFL